MGTTDDDDDGCDSTPTVRAVRLPADALKNVRACVNVHPSILPATPTGASGGGGGGSEAQAARANRATRAKRVKTDGKQGRMT